QSSLDAALLPLLLVVIFWKLNPTCVCAWVLADAVCLPSQGNFVLTRPSEPAPSCPVFLPGAVSAITPRLWSRATAGHPATAKDCHSTQYKCGCAKFASGARVGLRCWSRAGLAGQTLARQQIRYRQPRMRSSPDTRRIP